MVPARDGEPAIMAIFLREIHLPVRGRRAGLAGEHPHLHQVQRLVVARVRLGMANARSGAHELHAARFYHAAIAHAVLVFQFAGEDVGQNLHVAMRMCRKSHSRSDAIVVEHAQRTPMHVFRIEIVCKTERVIGV